MPLFRTTKNAACSILNVITGPLAVMTFIPSAIIALLSIQNIYNAALKLDLTPEEMLQLNEIAQRETNTICYAMLLSNLVFSSINIITAVNNLCSADQEVLPEHLAENRAPLRSWPKLKSATTIGAFVLFVVFKGLASSSANDTDPNNIYIPVYSLAANLMYLISSICLKAATQDYLASEGHPDQPYAAVPV